MRCMVLFALSLSLSFYAIMQILSTVIFSYKQSQYPSHLLDIRKTSARKAPTLASYLYDSRSVSQIYSSLNRRIDRRSVWFIAHIACTRPPKWAWLAVSFHPLQRREKDSFTCSGCGCTCCCCCWLFTVDMWHTHTLSLCLSHTHTRSKIWIVIHIVRRTHIANWLRNI